MQRTFFYRDYLSRPRLYNVVGSSSKKMLLHTPGKSIINFPWHTHWKTLVKFMVLIFMSTDGLAKKEKIIGLLQILG
jgi:signal recognition particle receptor subunit beta